MLWYILSGGGSFSAPSPLTGVWVGLSGFHLKDEAQGIPPTPLSTKILDETLTISMVAVFYLCGELVLECLCVVCGDETMEKLSSCFHSYVIIKPASKEHVWQVEESCEPVCWQLCSLSSGCGVGRGYSPKQHIPHTHPPPHDISHYL